MHRAVRDDCKLFALTCLAPQDAAGGGSAVFGRKEKAEIEMISMFQRGDSQGKTSRSRSAGRRSSERVPRHSSGWKRVLARLSEEPGLRILDIGPTSPNNINFLTSLGHSVYMADLVEEAVKPEWRLPTGDNEPERFEVDGFLARHMDFADRKFDAVLLWDALDYIPEPLAGGVIGKLSTVLTEKSVILALFHAKISGPGTAFCRYHVTDNETILSEERDPHPVLRSYQNRQIEALLAPLGACRVLLAKDNIREAVVSR